MTASPSFDCRIYVAGHLGLVGSAIVRCLRQKGYKNLVLRSHTELNLCDQQAVNSFFRSQQIEYVFFAAGRVGGIGANLEHQAEFLYENLTMAFHSIHAAYLSEVKKFLYLGSSCIYPRLAPQPIRESALLTGPLEPTNEGYAIAKIAAVKLCEKYYRQYNRRFISAMPTNLYGPGDCFHERDGHVIPALLRRFHEAKRVQAPVVKVWGSGAPLREFLHVDDLARALIMVMENYDEPQTINIGSGAEVSIRELAALIKEITGFSGTVEFDPGRPDGTPRKVLENEKIFQLGWRPIIQLKQGLQSVYDSAFGGEYC